MHVGAGAVPGIPDVGDMLVLIDPVSGLDKKLAAMSVYRDAVSAVVDPYGVPKGTFPPGTDDFSSI